MRPRILNEQERKYYIGRIQEIDPRYIWKLDFSDDSWFRNCLTEEMTLDRAKLEKASDEELQGMWDEYASYLAPPQFLDLK